MRLSQARGSLSRDGDGLKKEEGKSVGASVLCGGKWEALCVWKKMERFCVAVVYVVGSEVEVNCRPPGFVNCHLSEGKRGDGFVG